MVPLEYGGTTHQRLCDSSGGRNTCPEPKRSKLTRGTTPCLETDATPADSQPHTHQIYPRSSCHRICLHKSRSASSSHLGPTSPWDQPAPRSQIGQKWMMYSSPSYLKGPCKWRGIRCHGSVCVIPIRTPTQTPSSTNSHAAQLATRLRNCGQTEVAVAVICCCG